MSGAGQAIDVATRYFGYIYVPVVFKLFKQLSNTLACHRELGGDLIGEHRPITVKQYLKKDLRIAYTWRSPTRHTY